MEREEAKDAARIGEQLKTILLQILDEKYESALLNFKYLILDHIAKDLRRLLLLSALYRSPFDHFYDEIEYAYGKLPKEKEQEK